MALILCNILMCEKNAKVQLKVYNLITYCFLHFEFIVLVDEKTENV